MDAKKGLKDIEEVISKAIKKIGGRKRKRAMQIPPHEIRRLYASFYFEKNEV